MNRKRILLIVFIAISTRLAFSQNDAIDSLKQVLNNAKQDTIQVNALNGLAFELKSNDPDTALYFANKALALAKKINYKMGTANSYLNIGSIRLGFSESEEALKAISESITIYDKLLNAADVENTFEILKQKARAYSINGNAHFSQGDFSSAMKEYVAAMKIREELGDRAGIASCYNNIGAIYVEEGNYSEALNAHLAALKIREEVQDKTGIAASYNNIGIVYDGMLNYPMALKNYYASLKIRIEIGDKPGIAKSYNNIGGIQATLGNFPESIKNNLAALKIREEIGDKQGVANSYANIAGVYKQQEKYADALKSNFASLKISEKIGAKQNMAYALIAIGDIYIKQNKNRDALYYFNIGLQLAKEIGSLDYIKNAYSGLSTVNEAIGNEKLALNYYKQFITYRDSVYNEENTSKLVKAEMLYEFDKKESEIRAIQEKKDAIAEGEAKRQLTIRNTAFGGFAFLLLFSAIIYSQRNRLSKEKRRSDELVIDKELLIKEVHHRVKNNLEVISSLLELQGETIQDATAKAAVLEGQSRVQSIALIHHKLYQSDDHSFVEFKAFVNDLFVQIQSVFSRTGTQVDFTLLSEETKIKLDTAIPLGLIINELLTNSFKYAISEHHTNTILIQLKPQSNFGEYILIFRDNGPGFPEGYDFQKSTSLGMKIIQLLSKQLQGKMKQYNEQGSVFEISFVADKV